MKVRKRILSVMLTMVLCLGLCATALAEEETKNSSPEVDNSTTETQTVDLEAAKVDADMLNKLEEKQKAALNGSAAFKDADLTNDAANATASEKFVREEMKADLTSSKVIASKMVNLTMPEGASSVTYTIKVPGVKASHQVFMYHLKADGTWETISAKAGDGTITATFTSLSPVVYMVVERTTVGPQEPQPQQPAQQPQQPAPTPTNNPAKSPNTGADSNMALIVLFVMALGGAAWYGKKSFGNAR